MKDRFETYLTGSDGPVNGLVNQLQLKNYGQAFEFKSLDNTLQLVIAMDSKNKWYRIDGTEPYLSGWVNELAEHVAVLKH